MKKTKKIEKSFFFYPEQVSFLKKISAETQISMGEHVRNALSQYFLNLKKLEKQKIDLSPYKKKFKYEKNIGEIMEEERIIRKKLSQFLSEKPKNLEEIEILKDKLTFLNGLF